MRKISFVFLLVVVCSLTACINTTSPSEELCETVLSCFDEEDTETLKSLFCEEVQDTHDLDKEIAEAMRFFDGRAISYDNNFNGRDGISVDNGEVTDRHFVPIIDDIKTDTGNEYKITFYYYTVYTKDEKRVGINNIVIRDKQRETRYIIGDSDW